MSHVIPLYAGKEGVSSLKILQIHFVFKSEFLTCEFNVVEAIHFNDPWEWDGMCSKHFFGPLHSAHTVAVKRYLLGCLSTTSLAPHIPQTCKH